MTDRGAGIRIGKKAFLASFFVLLGLMLVAGTLTLAIPSGRYQRSGADSGAHILAGTYREIDKPAYPIWRWCTAPFEVLGSADGLQAIVIIVFIMIVGGAFSVLDHAHVLNEAVALMAHKFRARKYLLLGCVCLFFMGIGSLLGIFEETIPLVPVAIALATSLGWDIYVGLGMSVLATGFGFSAAIANPFSIGVAQRLSGLALFSGAGFRIVVFAAFFALYFAWLFRLARRSERKNASNGALSSSSGLAEPSRNEFKGKSLQPIRGVRFFAGSIAVLICVMLGISITKVFADYAMPLIALIFLVAGLGSGMAAGLSVRECLGFFVKGIVGILPGVILIMMALSVKHIMSTGGIIDTILHSASIFIGGASGYGTVLSIYFLTLGMNFFIGSATAKAFLLIPILAPLADLSGLSRQLAVQAFAFGDGFSNMIYPTNAVLLISLGIAGVSWIDWFKKTWFLQFLALLLSIILLIAGVATGYS